MSATGKPIVVFRFATEIGFAVTGVMSAQHRFTCSDGALTSADYLERAVFLDKIPDDPQTIDDYGFSRCETWNQKSHLLGLYKGLLWGLNV